MTLKDLLAEQLDPKELRFRVDQIISRLSELEKEKNKTDVENKRLKMERERMFAQQRRQQPINTSLSLKKNKPTIAPSMNRG